jgi:hypothetical protein
VFTSKKLRKHNRNSDHRSSESITEVQITEGQKVLQKFRSKKLRKHHNSSDQRISESIIVVQIKEAQNVS